MRFNRFTHISVLITIFNMVNDDTPILAKKHVSSLLIFLLNKGTVHKTDLVSVVHSNTSVDKLVNELKNEGFLLVRREFAGRNTYYISLTLKGKAAAQKLKEAQDVSEGIIHVDGEEINIKLNPEEQKNSQYLKYLFHFNVLDNHITVEEAVPGKPTRIFNIYIKQNGGGYFRLWCEADNSYDCWHVKEAWGYPEVQKMMTQYKGRIKICPVCGYENPENAKYCMECGAKLE